MTHFKTIAVSLVALAAVAVPASAQDHREHETRHNQIKPYFGVNLNLGNIRISSYGSGRGYRRYQSPRIYIALESGHRSHDHALARFQEIVRSRFAQTARGDFRLVSSPRHADIVIRLDRDDWGKAYRRYAKASKSGHRSDHFGRGTKMIDRVAERLLYRAYDMRDRSYRSVRYDRDDRYGRHHDDRRDRRYVQYRN